MRENCKGNNKESKSNKMNSSLVEAFSIYGRSHEEGVVDDNDAKGYLPRYSLSYHLNHREMTVMMMTKNSEFLN